MIHQRAIALSLLMLSMLALVLSFHWHPSAEASSLLRIRSVTMTVEGKTTVWNTIEDDSLLTVWLNASSEPILTVSLEPQQRTRLTAYTSLEQPLVEVVGGIILETIDHKAIIRAEKERCIVTTYGTAPSSDQWVLFLLQDSVGVPLLIMTATPPSIEKNQPEDALLQRLNEKIEDCPISESRKQYFVNVYYHAALEKNRGTNVTDFLTATLNQLKLECTSFQEAQLAINNASQALANQSVELSPEDQQTVDYFLELALLYLDAGRYQDALTETQRILEILNEPQINYVTKHLPSIVVISIAMVTILLVIKRRRSAASAEQGVSSPEVEGLIPP